MYQEEVVIEVFEWYQNIEKRLVEITSIIPFASESDLKNIYSPRLVPIMVETCSVIDTLFRDLMPEEFQRPGPKGRRMTRNGANIYDYYRELESSLQLGATKSLLLQGKPVVLCPFKKWSDQSSSPMDWWRVYNRLKHDRIKCSKEASLFHCIDALCALKQLMTKIPALMELSLRFSWVQTGGYNPTITIKEITEINASKYVAYSAFFATFLSPVSWESPDEIRPVNLRNNEKLIAHLGRLATKIEQET
jgi:hypothetical protein